MIPPGLLSPGSFSELISAFFTIETAVAFAATFVGVGLAEYFALRARRADARKKVADDRARDEATQRFVRIAASNGLAISLLAVTRHKHFLDGMGMPNSTLIPNPLSSLDPLRVIEELGGDLYEGLVAHGQMIELTNAYFTRVSRDYALAANTEAAQGLDRWTFAAFFHGPFLAQMNAMVGQLESTAKELLRKIDPERLKRLEATELPRLREHPGWMTK